jgi:hypothetical protein
VTGGGIAGRDRGDSSENSEDSEEDIVDVLLRKVGQYEEEYKGMFAEMQGMS